MPLPAIHEPNPDNTRTRLLDAAEYLFTVEGYQATSLRQITQRAQANLAAVNYHFGSKEGLMQDVLRRRLDDLNADRLAVLDALEAAAQGAPLRPSQIITAYFGVLSGIASDENRGGPSFLRLLGRTLTQPEQFVQTFLTDRYSVVLDRYKQAFFKALPDVPKAEIVWRFHFMLGATAYALAGIDALRLVTDWEIEPHEESRHFERLIPRLLSFLLGGLRGALPEFTADGWATTPAAALAPPAAPVSSGAAPSLSLDASSL
jgi:AcrR family transcriptional regulator